MSEYNGWTNYATWRVRLELLDGLTLSDIGFYHFKEETTSGYTVHQVARHLEDYVEQIIVDTTTEGVGRDYALAFVNDVDFDQIAEHMIEDETP